MKKSKKIKLKLIFGAVFALTWILIGIFINKVFDFHGLLWVFVFCIIFGIPFVKYVSDFESTHDDYIEAKTKEDFDDLKTNKS